jgi:hypothetical protein
MANEIYNTSWWGTALDTARTAGTNPDFFGSQMKLLTSEQDNLVTNGDFATDSNWGKSNATISDGKGNLDGDGQTSLLWQDILTNGKTYKATFTVFDYNELGEARVIDNSGSALYTITSNGTFTINFTHSIANGLFLFRARSGAVYSIDNVSVQLVRCDLDQIEAKKCLADWIHTTALKDLNN